MNRPHRIEEFKTGNTGFTEEICVKLRDLGRRPKIILSSSVQAELDNPYGESKRGAEETLRQYCVESGAPGVIFRLKNLFGKWCRPNYNSVTATYCHNIAHDLPIDISDPTKIIELTYIDDVVTAFLGELETTTQSGCTYAEQLPFYKVTLGELAVNIRFFHTHRETLWLPDYSNLFLRSLYATYLSYLEPDQYGYALNIKTDERGNLAEFIKSPHLGQIFISRTKPGITRGNHYHHTKTEKFMVVQGEGIIRLRHILGGEVTEYRIRGEEYRVVDIPPGYTHSIENVGADEMVTLFWASEIFDSTNPDTFFKSVL